MSLVQQGVVGATFFFDLRLIQFIHLVKDDVFNMKQLVVENNILVLKQFVSMDCFYTRGIHHCYFQRVNLESKKSEVK